VQFDQKYFCVVQIVVDWIVLMNCFCTFYLIWYFLNQYHFPNYQGGFVLHLNSSLRRWFLSAFFPKVLLILPLLFQCFLFRSWQPKWFLIACSLFRLRPFQRGLLTVPVGYCFSV